MLSGDICPVWLSSVFLFACVLLILFFFFFEALSLFFFVFFFCVCVSQVEREEKKKKRQKKKAQRFFAGQTLCRKPYIYKLKEIMKKEAQKAVQQIEKKKNEVDPQRPSKRLFGPQLLLLFIFFFFFLHGCTHVNACNLIFLFLARLESLWACLKTRALKKKKTIQLSVGKKHYFFFCIFHTYNVCGSCNTG